MTPATTATPSPWWSSLLTAASTLAAAMPAIAAPTACPVTAEVTQQAKNVPDGFTPYVTTSRHMLRAIGLSDGAPNEPAPGETAWLASGSTRRQGKGRVSIWHFTPNQSHIWISCVYDDTSVKLSFPLPLATTQCEVTYTELNRATTFTCK